MASLKQIAQDLVTNYNTQQNIQRLKILTQRVKDAAAKDATSVTVSYAIPVELTDVNQKKAFWNNINTNIRNVLINDTITYGFGSNDVSIDPSAETGVTASTKEVKITCSWNT